MTEKVFEVIEKHIYMNNLLIDDIIKEKEEKAWSDEDFHAHVGAITALTMLKKELKGEMEF